MNKLIYLLLIVLLSLNVNAVEVILPNEAGLTIENSQAISTQNILQDVSQLSLNVAELSEKIESQANKNNNFINYKINELIVLVIIINILFLVMNLVVFITLKLKKVS